MVILEVLLIFLYALATFLSFAEEWFIGELAASLRWHWLLGGILLALYFGLRRKPLFLLAVLALASYHAPSLYHLATADKPPKQEVSAYHTLRVYQHNTLRFKDNTEAVMAWLKAHGSAYDIVFLQEVSPKLNEQIPALLPEFPYIIPAYFEQRFDNVVLSKFPIASFEIRMFQDLQIGYIRCQFSLDNVGSSVVMYGMHATAPISPAYWHARNGQFAHIAHEIAADAAPHKFLVGDFNLTPYSPIFASLLKVSGLRNSMVGYGLENTWGSFLPARIFGIPIDHLLMSEEMYVKEKQVGEDLGSDHFSVSTTLAVPVATVANPASR